MCGWSLPPIARTASDTEVTQLSQVIGTEKVSYTCGDVSIMTLGLG